MTPDHSTPWVSGGVQHQIDTYCQPGETPERCLERHNEAVAAAQVIWPPD
jgi:hypothetical protein